jgi:hypothetical protein
MTYRRLVARNKLSGGNYSLPPPEWANLWSKGAHSELDETLCGYENVAALENAYRELWKRQQADRGAFGGVLSTITGDLRRFERDSLDENAIVDYIIHRLGYEVNRDDIAAIIRFFFEF